jgi:iron(III) transport system permease protein
MLTAAEPFRGLKLGALWALGLVAILPLVAIAIRSADADNVTLQRIFSIHFAKTLPLTVGYLAITALVSGFVGTGLAWLVTFHDFPGRRILQWLAFLPLAMPGYIIAFVLTDYLSYAGPLQSWWRSVNGYASPSDYLFPEIRSLWGAGLVMGLILYPYVYAPVRASFLKQARQQLDVARTLGRSEWQAITTILLPQSWPAIAIGVTLALLESLNDIGAAVFFGLNTVTTGIFSLWQEQGNLAGAALLSMLVLAMVIVAMLFVRRAEASEHVLHGQARAMPVQLRKLSGGMRVLATLLFLIPIFIGFVLPVMLLIKAAWRRVDTIPTPEFLDALIHTVQLAVLASIVTVVAALVLGYATRGEPGSLTRMIKFIASLGYAVPGTILGLGVLVSLGTFDRWINAATILLFDWKPGLILSGSIATLVFAYGIRFLTISANVTDQGFARITPNIDAAARTMGRSTWRRVTDIHLPILKPSLAVAFILVLVDAMKELPATLLLRPFDFETLATYLFASASLGQLEDAAIPALAIVAAGLVPVILLSRGLETRRD